MDVGGTKIVGALFGGRRQHRLDLPTWRFDGRADPGGARPDGSRLTSWRDLDGLDGVGVSVCEYVDAGRVASREVLAWPLAHGWLEEAFGLERVVVESDARCAAQRRDGRTASCRAQAGGLPVRGTGISGCLVVEGRLVADARAVGPSPSASSSSRAPGLEAFASGAAMA